MTICLCIFTACFTYWTVAIGTGTLLVIFFFSTLGLASAIWRERIRRKTADSAVLRIQGLFDSFLHNVNSPLHLSKGLVIKDLLRWSWERVRESRTEVVTATARRLWLTRSVVVREERLPSATLLFLSTRLCSVKTSRTNPLDHSQPLPNRIARVASARATRATRLHTPDPSTTIPLPAIAPTPILPTLSDCPAVRVVSLAIV